MTGQCRVDLKLNRFISARQHWPVGRNTYIWIKKGSDAAGVPSVCMDRMSDALCNTSRSALCCSAVFTHHDTRLTRQRKSSLYGSMVAGSIVLKAKSLHLPKRCFFCGLFNKRLGAVEFVLSYRFGRFWFVLDYLVTGVEHHHFRFVFHKKQIGGNRGAKLSQKRLCDKQKQPKYRLSLS